MRVGSANLSVFRWINHWPEALAPTMKFFSEATNFTWVKVALLAMVVAMILAKGTLRKTAVQALLAFPLANGITDLFKKGIPMPRPFQELDAVVLRAGWSESAGTASAHSANMAAVAVVFAYHLGWRGSPWVLVAVFTGLSRIYNGVHYPYQVLLGWTVGILAGFIIVKGWEQIQLKRAPVLDGSADAKNVS